MKETSPYPTRRRTLGMTWNEKAKDKRDRVQPGSKIEDLVLVLSDSYA